MANFCDKCGAELDERTGLCPVCAGAPVSGGILRDVPLEQPAPYVWKKRTARFCSRCGGPVDPQTGFCPACGVTSGYTPTPAEQPAPPPPQSEEKQPPQIEEQQTKQQTSGRQIPPQQSKEKKRGHAALWVVTIVSVLLAVAAVVGVLEHFQLVYIPAVEMLEERMGISPYEKAIYDENGVLQGYKTYGYGGFLAPVELLLYL